MKFLICGNPRLQSLGGQVCNLWQRSSFLISVLLPLSFSLQSKEASQITEIHIFHTNDILGQIEPIKGEAGNSIGGVLRLGYLVASKRKELDSFLLLDAGNAIGPNSLVRFTNGMDQIRVMNLLGYTAMALGEMEFIYGPEALNRCTNEAKFPILSANVVYKDTEKYFVKPYFIYSMSENLKIGITAVTEVDIPLSAYGFGHLEISPPLGYLREIIDTMKEVKHCDLIIVLSNLGQEEDMKLAESMSDIDIIIGGNVRTMSPSKVYHSIPQDLNIGVSLVRSTPLTTALGDIFLKLEKCSGKVQISKIDFHSFYLNEQTYPLEKIEEEIPEFKKFVEEDIIERWKPKEGIIIGKVEENEAIGLTDMTLLLMQKKANAELALCDRELFGWFSKDIKLQDNVKASDIDNGIPFNDNLVIVEMKGDDILEVIYHHQAQRGTTRELAFLQNFDPALEEINHREIEEDERYIIAVNSYLADQGAGYTMFEDAKVIRDTDTKIRDIVLNYIEERSANGKRISLLKLRRWVERTLWKYKIELSGKLGNFSKSKNSDSYHKAQFGTPKYNEWEVGPNFILTGRSRPQMINLTVSPQYGKRTSFVGDSVYKQEIADWVNADLDYRRFVGERGKLYTQLLLKLCDLEITPEEEDLRKGSISANMGIGYEFSSKFNLSGGIGRSDRLSIPGRDYGLYLNSKYERRLFRRLKLNLNGHLFLILKPGEVNYDNETIPRKGDYTAEINGKLKVPLTRNIYLNLNTLFYRDTSIGGWAWALNTFITLELIHGLLP